MILTCKDPGEQCMHSIGVSFSPVVLLCVRLAGIKYQGVYVTAAGLAALPELLNCRIQQCTIWAFLSSALPKALAAVDP